MKIAFYISNINNIGGVESWIYYIGKLYGEGRDITMYYSTGDEKQLNRLKSTMKVRRFYYQKIDCDVAIFCINTPNDEILCFNAKKERIQFIHACYTYAYNLKELKPNPLIDRYIAVSQTAADDFYKLTGLMPEVVYNPIYIEKPKKILKLISATRISKDKGSIWERMRVLAKALNDNNIPFIWLVFTNNVWVKSDIPNVIFMPSSLSITDYIAEADYLVQLSKTEAFAYSVIESLSLGTAVIVTNFLAALEMGIEDGKNGYILNMDMENIDVDKIYNHIPKFQYKLKESEKEWLKILGEKRKNIPKDKMVKVKCKYKFGFPDGEVGRKRRYGEVWECTEERAEYLINYHNPHLFTNEPVIDIIG